MPPQAGCLTGLVLAILVASSGCSSGRLSLFHPAQPALPDFQELCSDVPQSCKDRVHVFLIHGLDPLDYANLQGVRDYVNSLGFRKTYYGQLFHARRFEEEIRRIHQQDPEARFVLMGFSFGANKARNITHDVKGDGVSIDLLLYCGGNTFENIPRDRPDNAMHIVNVLAHGYIWNGAQLDNAENISVEDVWHFGSPYHPRTLEILTKELASISASVSVPPAPPAAAPGDSEEPRPPAEHMPRAETKAERDEWDFLKPVGHLSVAPAAKAKHPADPVATERLAARATP